MSSQDETLESDRGSDYESDDKSDGEEKKTMNIDVDVEDRSIIRSMDPSDTLEKATALVNKCLKANESIYGTWDETLLIWKYVTAHPTIWLLNIMYKQLDPEGKLPRVLTLANIRQRYCPMCRIVVTKYRHNMSKRNPQYGVCGVAKRCYTNTRQYWMYLVKHRQFNFIERAVLIYVRNKSKYDKHDHYGSAQYRPEIKSLKRPIHIMSTYNTNMKHNSIKYNPASETFSIRANRRKNISRVNFFINEDITHDDAARYNKDGYDAYLVDLLNGRENYDTFMYELTSALIYRPKVSRSLFIKGLPSQTSKVKEILIRLFHRFIRMYSGDNINAGFIQVIKLIELNDEPDISIKGINQRIVSGRFYSGIVTRCLTIIMGTDASLRYSSYITAYPNVSARCIKLSDDTADELGDIPPASYKKVALDIVACRYREKSTKSAAKSYMKANKKDDSDDDVSDY